MDLFTIELRRTYFLSQPFVVWLSVWWSVWFIRLVSFQVFCAVNTRQTTRSLTTHLDHQFQRGNGMGKILSFASLAKQNKTCFEPHTNWHERGRETLAIFLSKFFSPASFQHGFYLLFHLTTSTIPWKLYSLMCFSLKGLTHRENYRDIT